MQTRYKIGIDAEELAASYLIGKGYTILHRRYKTKYGEVDIIAESSNCLVFVEVKSKKHDVEYAISDKQTQRVSDAASMYLAENPTNKDCRFDAILISQTNINHIENIIC
jgi:putative endonuclease